MQEIDTPVVNKSNVRNRKRKALKAISETESMYMQRWPVKLAKKFAINSDNFGQEVVTYTKDHIYPR